MAFFRLALGFLVVALLGVVDFLWVPRRLGSSKEKLSTNTCLLGGFVPACAGGTTQCRPSPPLIPGLSPRVRGNQADLNSAQVSDGSIPARAGEPMTG